MSESITPITVNVENFSTGPATELRKLQLYYDAIVQLQSAVMELTNAQANGDSELSQVIVTGNGNGGVPMIATLAAFIAPAPL